MSAWVVMPVIVPAFAAVLLLLAPRSLAFVRLIGIAATVAVLAISATFVIMLDANPIAYQVGNWPAPYGIVLVVDRLSALMLLLTSTIALLALAHSLAGWDRRGISAASFHALFQLELMGLNGAFLTGDVFNLFVFFEVLLLASIGLLVHGGGADRARHGLRYAVINLVGSSLLLAGVALLYGVAGTLNMADLAVVLPRLDPERARLARVAGTLLLVGFGVKAAVFPLYFWLPGSYSAAAAPVAALFAIMTKVGVYALLRICVLVYGGLPGGTADALLWVGLCTLALGTAGVLASRDLGRFAGYLTISSVGLMLAGVGLFTPAGTSAALFYLVQSAISLAGLFLLRELVAAERLQVADRFEPGPPLTRSSLLPTLYWLLIAAAVGLPPLTGFMGKIMLLRSSADTPIAGWIWVSVLVSSLLLILAAASAGSQVFWAVRESETRARASRLPPATPAAIAVALQFVLVIAAEPLRAYTEAAASELHTGERYRAAVLGQRAASLDPAEGVDARTPP